MDALCAFVMRYLENRRFYFVCLNEQNILWQLITDHDDIFQTHIVCKLNGADSGLS